MPKSTFFSIEKKFAQSKMASSFSSSPSALVLVSEDQVFTFPRTQPELFNVAVLLNNTVVELEFVVEGQNVGLEAESSGLQLVSKTDLAEVSIQSFTFTVTICSAVYHFVLAGKTLTATLYLPSTISNVQEAPVVSTGDDKFRADFGDNSQLQFELGYYNLINDDPTHVFTYTSDEGFLAASLDGCGTLSIESQQRTADVSLLSVTTANAFAFKVLRGNQTLRYTITGTFSTCRFRPTRATLAKITTLSSSVLDTHSRLEPPFILISAFLTHDKQDIS